MKKYLLERIVSKENRAHRNYAFVKEDIMMWHLITKSGNRLQVAKVAGNRGRQSTESTAIKNK